MNLTELLIWTLADHYGINTNTLTEINALDFYNVQDCREN